MRQDLAKVICEDGRRGPRGDLGYQKAYERRYRYRTPEDRTEEYAELDALPSRQPVGRPRGQRRGFSENLGPLRGLIARSRGKHWDRVYSELCRLVSPTGTNIERHVHQHLPDFIHTQTRLGEDGVEYFDRWGCWRPISDGRRWRRVDYFVHPVSRCVLRIKRRPYREPPERPTILPGAHDLSRYAMIRGIWFELRLQPAEYRTVVIGGTQRLEVFSRDIAADLVEQALRARGVHRLSWRSLFENERRRRILAYGADLVASAKRTLSRKELRRLGLVNDPPRVG
jgi:hypothetical protein